MRVAVYSSKPYDRDYLDRANSDGRHELVYLESRLDHDSARAARGFPALCLFVNDSADAVALEQLAAEGLRLIVLRCAGFNNVDLEAAQRLDIRVARVPEYSPHAVAEHTMALILALNRKIHRAYNRVREGNFALQGLLGVDLHRRPVGLVGTGKIGACLARILLGFGCEVLAFDPQPDPLLGDAGVRYLGLDALLPAVDILSLHCPLTPATRHLINGAALARMRRGAMLVNTSRGAVIDTRAVIKALKTGHLGSLALDVYEEEADLFFRDLSERAIADDVFARLLTFPNVLITGHQGFFTHEALTAIAETTLDNLDAFAATGEPHHGVSVERLA
jgi:D-lactate dehydrogenase